MGISFFFRAYGITEVNVNWLAILLMTSGGICFFLLPLLYALVWGPLQSAERHLTPHLIELFQKDKWLKLFFAWILFFSIICFAVAAHVVFVQSTFSHLIIAIWLVFLGVTFDCFYLFIKRVFHYLNPITVLELFTQSAKTDIQNERERDLCDSIDAISEISLRSVEGIKLSLCNRGVDELQKITSQFLESVKSISHQTEDAQSKEMGVQDKVKFTVLYVLQRIEMIFDAAIKKHIEPLCSFMIATLGKIAYNGAKLDITMTNYPLHFLGKLAKKAQQEGMQDVGIKASLALLEVSRSIITDLDLTYVDIQGTFLMIVNLLSELTKETFRLDKSINFKVLTQPLYDLKNLFSQDKIATHRDTPVIVQAINSAIAEFDALEAIMRTLPPIPKIEGETETEAAK